MKIIALAPVFYIFAITDRTQQTYLAVCLFIYLINYFNLGDLSIFSYIIAYLLTSRFPIHNFKMQLNSK